MATGTAMTAGPGTAGTVAAGGSGRGAEARRRRLGGPAGSVRFSARVARRLCARVEAGESLRAICADAEMPHRSTVRAWMDALPAFATAVQRARRAAGWHMLGGRPPMWCEALASEVCARLAAGEPLSRICDDPEMPSLSLVYRWRVERPAFARAVELARQVQAERFFDLGWEIAMGVTPADAFATHVKLTQLRWTAAALAPTRFGKFRPVVAETTALDEAEAAERAEAEGDDEERSLTVYIRHFKREEQPDGTVKVVAYRQHCVTGELVRDDSDDE